MRSDEIRERLKREGIRLTLKEDGADIPNRLAAMQRGDVDLAVFTIDSLLLAGANAGSFPGSIVLIVDETRGADAIVAYEQVVPSLDALNDTSARIVATAASPSEFLARVAVANFNLPDLPHDWLEARDGAKAVYKAFRVARSDERKAFVMWEPYVSLALEEPDAKILLDTSKLSGYVMDVLVARREFLRDHEDVVRNVVEAYLRTAYEANRTGAMIDLVVKDAKKTGTKGIKDAQAKKMVEGIAWRNTLENYVQFGLLKTEDSKGLPHLEDVILRIVDVLRKTNALSEDPLDGQANILFYDKILRDLKKSNFHPGKTLNLLNAGDKDLDFESVRSTKTLPPLTDAERQSLVQVGEMRVDPLSFGRGGAKLNVSSRRNLVQLAQKLEAFPAYYLTVVGHTRVEGDAEANARLAHQRAEAARNFLLSQGLPSDRVFAEAASASHHGATAQSVSFIVGQLPY